MFLLAASSMIVTEEVDMLRGGTMIGIIITKGMPLAIGKAIVVAVHIWRMKGVILVTPLPTKVIMPSSFVGKRIEQPSFVEGVGMTTSRG